MKALRQLDFRFDKSCKRSHNHVLLESKLIATGVTDRRYIHNITEVRAVSDSLDKVLFLVLSRPT